MQLENIQIRLIKYGAQAGTYEGQVKFVGGSGDISLNLDDTMTKRVLSICADEIVSSSRQVAEALTAEVVTGQAMIDTAPAPSDSDEK